MSVYNARTECKVTIQQVNTATKLEFQLIENIYLNLHSKIPHAGIPIGVMISRKNKSLIPLDNWDIGQSEAELAPEIQDVRTARPTLPTNELPSRFASAKSDKEVSAVRKKFVPKKTLEDTTYCVRLWNQWAEYRTTTTNGTY